MENEKIIYKSPLNFTGAKDQQMLGLSYFFPKDVDTFYDVFAGGLSVTIISDYQKIVANDIITPMIEFYKEMQELNLEDFLYNVKAFAIPKDSPEDYAIARELFNKESNPYLFFALVSSCTNNMMRFNKKLKFNQTFGKRTINDNTIFKLTNYHKEINKKNITFTSLPYREFLTKQVFSKNDFVYLDPPYLITEAGYNAYWSMEDERMLYYMLEMLNEQGIRFIMSNVSEHNGKVNPFLHRLTGFEIIEVPFEYEKVARKKGKGTKEIIVKNF